MALKSYIFTTDYKSPYVTATGLPHNPQAIRFRKFKKGEIANGELKHANNKPAFILVSGVCVVPLTVVKELVTKAVVEHDDSKQSTSSADGSQKKVAAPTKKSGGVKYIDAMIIGGIVGVGAVFLAEKQGWIKEPDKKYKLYGAAIGAAAGMYLVYRGKNTVTAKPKPNVKETKE
jgi:hypothetical protein